jgi:hypothetical protein
VDPQDYPLLAITLEPDDGDEQMNGAKVMQASFAP